MTSNLTQYFSSRGPSVNIWVLNDVVSLSTFSGIRDTLSDVGKRLKKCCKVFGAMQFGCFELAVCQGGRESELATHTVGLTTAQPPWAESSSLQKGLQQVQHIAFVALICGSSKLNVSWFC